MTTTSAPADSIPADGDTADETLFDTTDYEADQVANRRIQEQRMRLRKRQGFRLAGDPRPDYASGEYPVWHGWGIPPRVALIGRDSVGKSTIMANAAAWYASRGKYVLVASFEGFDEWNDLVDAYPDDEKWDLYDWTTGTWSLSEYDAEWDTIMIDPGIGFFTHHDRKENDNSALRKLLRETVGPSLRPGGHIWVAWHTGHEHQHRGRGMSDLSAWARMTMRYQRSYSEPVGRLTVTRANKNQGTHKPLAVTVDGQGRAVISRADTEPTKADRLRQILAFITENPGTTNAEIAKAVELSRQAVSGYLTALDGTIRRVKDGKRVQLYPCD